MDYKEYSDEINNIFSYYSENDYVDSDNCWVLKIDMMGLMVDATAELSGRRQFKELFDLANSALLKWETTGKDDSNGETREFISCVIGAWDVVYDAEDERINHDIMLEWFLNNMNRSDGRYWEFELYTYMMNHFKEPVLLEKKMEFLNERVEIYRSSGNESQIKYSMPLIQLYLMIVMGDLHYPIEEVRAYAATIGQTNSSVKEKLAEIEYNYGNVDEALRIYKELECSKNSLWGSYRYSEQLMNIYKKLGNHDKYFEYLNKAMSSPSAAGKLELLEEYKSNFTTEEWPAIRDKLFNSIKNQYDACAWYVEEGKYDLIMYRVEAFSDTNMFKVYEEKLKALYPERCLAFLLSEVKWVESVRTARFDYRYLVRLLKLIKKYPDGEEITKSLVQKYQNTYNMRLI